MIEYEPRDTDREWPVALLPGAAVRQLNWMVHEGHIGEEAAQKVWDMLVAPLYDTRQAGRDWPRQQCRVCQALHPSHRDYERSVYRRAHQMRCPKYVGPLEHRRNRSDVMFMGHINIECTCGTRYNELDTEDSPQNCPDAAVDWRGPRPVQ
jgi:hypothetical protein